MPRVLGREALLNASAVAGPRRSSPISPSDLVRAGSVPGLHKCRVEALLQIAFRAPVNLSRNPFNAWAARGQWTTEQSTPSTSQRRRKTCSNFYAFSESGRMV